MIRKSVLLGCLLSAIGAAGAPAQDLAGCWAGTIAAGNARRRAALELVKRDGGWAGAVHVLSRSIDTDSLADIAVAGTDVRFTVPSQDSQPTFAGRLGGAELSGEMTRGTQTVPFALTRAGETGDPAVGLVGYWSGGLLQGDAVVMRLGLEFVPAPCGQVLLTMDSPDQGAEDLPVTALALVGDSLTFEMSYLGGAFRGALAPGWTDLSGTWTQAGQRLGLRLALSDSAPSFRRPQDPEPPLPYAAEDASYENPRDGTRFAGTLTIPEGAGPFPAALLITGSGAQNRDEAIMGHRPFLVIADYLTRRGIAVLRVDDRGVGGSTGNLMASTIDDNAGDALAGVAYLRAHPKIDPARVGLIGHSEGGWVAPLAASRSSDVAYVVLLAGPAVSGEELRYAQTRAFAEASGDPEPLIAGNIAVARRMYEIIKSEPDDSLARARLRGVVEGVTAELPAEQAAALDSAWSGPDMEQQFEQQLGLMVTPWFRYLLAYEPEPALASLRVPVLALFGEKDLQVPPTQSVPTLRQVTAKNPDVTIEVLDDLNHLFQHAESGLVSEYARIDETFAPEALERLGDWIAERFAARR